jgi:hypothetical protein
VDLVQFGRCLSTVDPLGFSLCSCGYMLDPFDLCFSSSETLMFFCTGPMGPEHDDFLTIYYNKVCLALLREGR